MRTKKQIATDYQNFLKKSFDRDFTEDEAMKLLMEKLYDTKIHNGATVSSTEAWWHFINFVIKEEQVTKQKCWNRFVKEAFELVEFNRYSAFVAARGLGKSFVTFVLYPIFKKFLFENMDILICTNIPKMAKRNLRILKRVVDTNEMLLEKKDMTNMKLLKWGDTELEYNKGMIETVSLGSTPRSAHVPLVIIDDPLRDDNTYSDEYVENFILKQVVPCTGRTKGRVILNGTFQHPQDIFHKIMGSKPDFRGKIVSDGTISDLGFCSKVFPAVEDWATKTAYLPEVYSWEDLMQLRKTIGELAFSQEYLCQVVPNKSVIFPWPLIRQCIPSEPELEQIEQGQPGKFYVIGVDLASSASKTADFTSFAVIEYDIETSTKILRKVVNDRMTAEEQEELLINLAKDFNNAFVMVEKNNIGEWMRQKLESANVYVNSFVTSRQSKQNAIKFLRNELSNKRILFPPLEGEMTVLRKQLTSFGYKMSRGKRVMEALSGHDDVVDALWIANMATQDAMGSPSAAYCQ